MNNQIEWHLVSPVRKGPKKPGKHRDLVVSSNIEGLPNGKDLISVAYGQSIHDLKGIKRESISYWSVDESGSTGRTEKTMGKVITYSAVTQLSNVDYDKLFDRIPKAIDKKGNEEIHYKELRDNFPVELERLVDRISDSPFLILSLPIEKTKIDSREVWPKPKNAAYVFRALWNVVDAIKMIDLSDMIVISFDQTDDMNDIFLDVFWNDRIIVRMEESYAAELYQISDIAASVTGNAINYPGELNSDLFWKLYSINSNITKSSAKADVSGKAKIMDNKNTKKRRWLIWRG